jgi:misacylated tRNA(Ala) deacylase
MSLYLCHEQPDLLDFDAQVIAARPGAVVLSRSAMHPGGGGQLSDQAQVRGAGGTARIVEVRYEDGQAWHVLDQPLLLEGEVGVAIDAARRALLARMHTATHVLNALVYQRFDGALVSGAQILGDGTGRMDFDLPDGDNDALRALEPELAREIRQARPVRTVELPIDEARAVPGLLRSAAVAPPPTPDGRIRIVDIEGLDRQACGGTHVANTAQIGGLRIVKVENKGRHNRRVRLVLADD